MDRSKRDTAGGEVDLQPGAAPAAAAGVMRNAADLELGNIAHAREPMGDGGGHVLDRSKKSTAGEGECL